MTRPAAVSRIEGDPARWCVGWCPVRIATEAVVWRPVSRDGSTWRWDGRAWVRDERLPRGVQPWEHRHGPGDDGGDVFELPAHGADVPSPDSRPRGVVAPLVQLGAELPPVEGEDSQGDASTGAALDATPANEGHAPAADEPVAAVEHQAEPVAAVPYVPPQSVPYVPPRAPARPRYAPREPLPDDARTVREALRDPLQLARALGFCEGRAGWGKGATWRTIAGGVQVLCPAHQERSPSCSITRGDDGTVRVRCFGCDLAGDALHLVAAVHGLDVRAHFRHVLGAAADIAGVRLDDASRRAATPPPRRVPPPAPPPPVDAVSPDAFAELARVLFEACSLDAPDAGDVRAYLDGRGILGGALADGWGALPSSLRAQGDVRARIVASVGVEVWERSGLAHPCDGDRFAYGSTHRVCIPWRDVDGRITWLQRRAPGTVDGPRYVAPRGVEPSAPYGAAQLAALDSDAPVAVVEGAVDALALRAALAVDGRAVAVLAVPGVAGWRRGWSALVHGRAVAVASDDDAAGDRFAAQLGAELAGVATAVERWRPVEGKDWSEAWQRRRTG